MSMRLRLELDQQTTDRLIEVAVEERRPVGMQAEVILRRALGLATPPQCVICNQGKTGHDRASV
jgi:hypothetical protein